MQIDKVTPVSVTTTAYEGHEFIGWEGINETKNNISLTLSRDFFNCSFLDYVVSDIIIVSNGVTIKCYGATIGFTKEVNGKANEVFDNDEDVTRSSFKSAACLVTHK